MSLRAGKFELHEVRDGTFALDGGAMFGVVPRVLWEKKFAPDEKNRITLALRCLLVVEGKRKILVDCGIGRKWDEKRREMYRIDQSQMDLDRELSRAKVKREEITDVILTHLHFDHVGGLTRDEGGRTTMSFPNATYHLQRRNWVWAHHASEKDAGAFRASTFEALDRSGRLHLLEGATELCPGVDIFVSEGHTVGLQLVKVSDGDRTVAYCGDLVPTAAHLRASWVMAYDLYPLTAIEEKKMLLAQAAEEGWVLFFEHDPNVAACTVKEDQGEVVVNEVVKV